MILPFFRTLLPSLKTLYYLYYSIWYVLTNILNYGPGFYPRESGTPGNAQRPSECRPHKKYPTLVFEASVSICASKFKSKSRTFHYPRPKKIIEFWPMRRLKQVAPITWEIPPPWDWQSLVWSAWREAPDVGLCRPSGCRHQKYDRFPKTTWPAPSPCSIDS